MNNSPTTASFSTQIHVQPADIDLLGHVSNLVYVEWVQRVASEHSRVLGWDYKKYQEYGGVFVVRRHEIDYLRPVFDGEKITATTWISEMKSVSCTRMTRMYRTDNQMEVARATTLWAFVSIKEGRLQRIPKELCELFQQPVMHMDE
jgi:acyl-CoA thioester hydrolase